MTKSEEKPEAKPAAKSEAKSNEKKPEAMPESATKSGDAIVAKLEAAAKGLLYISETDAPLTPFFWPSEAKTLTPELVAQLAKLPDKTKIETRTLDEFFKPVATEEDWMNDDEKAEARKFGELAQTLKDNLSDITVYRAGEIKIDVFVAGKVEGGFAGVATKVVET